MSNTDQPRMEVPQDVNWDNLQWHENADEVRATQSVGQETVNGCLHTPQRRVLAPESADKGYPVVRYVRGDVMVVVGFQEGPEWPFVMAVYRLSDNNTHAQKTYRTAAGAQGGSKVPRSYRQLSSAIVSMGYRIKPGNHPRVVTVDGIFVYSLPGTASDVRSLPNTWHGFLRAAEMIPAKPDETDVRP